MQTFVCQTGKHVVRAAKAAKEGEGRFRTKVRRLVICMMVSCKNKDCGQKDKKVVKFGYLSVWE